MKFYCLGHYGGGDYYVTPEEGLRNNLLLHSGPIFSDFIWNACKDIFVLYIYSFGTIFSRFYVFVTTINFWWKDILSSEIGAKISDDKMIFVMKCE